jgi:hypothetical protein
MTSRLFRIVSSGIALANAHAVWFCIVPPSTGSDNITVFASNYHDVVSGGVIISGGSPGSEEFGPICEKPYAPNADGNDDDDGVTNQLCGGKGKHMFLKSRGGGAPKMLIILRGFTVEYCRSSKQAE